MKIVTISVLLAMPTEYIGFYSSYSPVTINPNRQLMSRFYNCIVQQQALLYATNEAIEDPKTQIKNAIKSTTEPIQSAGTMLTTDSQRLLRICAGLRFDIKRMEVHQHGPSLQGKKQQNTQSRKLPSRSRELHLLFNQSNYQFRKYISS